VTIDFYGGTLIKVLILHLRCLSLCCTRLLLILQGYCSKNCLLLRNVLASKFGKILENKLFVVKIVPYIFGPWYLYVCFFSLFSALFSSDWSCLLLLALTKLNWEDGPIIQIELEPHTQGLHWSVRPGL